MQAPNAHIPHLRSPAMSTATAHIGTGHYAVTIDAGGYALLADEPATRGGAGKGPGPYDLLLASLAACTAITLRMYADRKQWDLAALRVDLHFVRRDGKQHVDRTLITEGELTDAQRARLVEIADRTPVTLTLKGGVSITTTLDPPLAASADAADDATPR
jgi:putative redox protein